MDKKTLLNVSQVELTLSDVGSGRAVSRASFAPSKSAVAYLQTLRGIARRWEALYINPITIQRWSEFCRGGAVEQATTDTGSVTYTRSIWVAVESVTLVGSATTCE